MDRKFHIFAEEFADNITAGCDIPRILIATDASLDEGAIIRTIAEPTPLSSGVEYFLGLQKGEAEILYVALNNLRDSGYEIDSLLDPGSRLERLLDHIRSEDHDFDWCDECRRAIPDRDGGESFHADFCSLHPKNIVERIKVEEWQYEQMLDAKVMRALRTDSRWRNAENAEEQSEAEEVISEECDRELRAKYEVI